MKRAVLACLVAACSSPQRAERPPADAARDATLAINAPPADAFVTRLIPPDAPARGTVIVTTSDGGECGFMILDLLYFESGKAELRAHQQPMADAIAKAIECATRDGSITKIEVQGHADDKERDPQRLSEERAVLVANFLASRGVKASILVPVGYGAASPIDHKKTERARAKNRRVMFLILERRKDD
jgi:outer membrane protein OmpA-like peptidoglycan-associated protein